MADLTNAGQDVDIVGPLGQAAMAASIPVVIASDHDSSRSASGSIGALNAAVAIAVRDDGVVKFYISSGTLDGTCMAEATVDGSNWVWVPVISNDSSGPYIGDESLGPGSSGTFVCAPGWQQVRIRCDTYSSGSSTCTLRASQGDGANAVQVIGTVSVGGSVSVSSGNVTAQRPSSSTAPPTQVASSASSGVLKSSNSSRLGLHIFNDSTAILYVKLQAATASSTSYNYKVFPQEGVWVDVNYTGEVRGIWASANGYAYVTEWTA